MDTGRDRERREEGEQGGGTAAAEENDGEVGVGVAWMAGESVRLQQFFLPVLSAMRNRQHVVRCWRVARGRMQGEVMVRV